MMTLKDKNDVLRDALLSISKITARGFRDAIGASEEEKYNCAKTAFDEIAKVVASVVRRDLFGDEPPKRGLIGTCANNRHFMCWNYKNELDIVCRVVGDAEENAWWEFSLESLGLVRAHGTIHGGKWLAIRLAEALRDGMTRYRLHRRKTHSNRAARKSAAAKEGK